MTPATAIRTVRVRDGWPVAVRPGVQFVTNERTIELEALPALLFLAVLIGSFVMWVWALVDAIRVRDDAQYRTGTKTMWVLLIALTQALGAVIYVLVGRPRQPTAP